MARPGGLSRSPSLSRQSSFSRQSSSAGPSRQARHPSTLDVPGALVALAGLWNWRGRALAVFTAPPPPCALERSHQKYLSFRRLAHSVCSPGLGPVTSRQVIR